MYDHSVSDTAPVAGGLKLLQPRRFADARGWFSETYSSRREASLGIDEVFVQDNQSYSKQAFTIRGLHFQRPPHAQAKLVRCVAGAIMDYAIDLRRGSPTFGRHVAVELSARNGRQLYVPVGFAHAFITLEDDTEVAYKVSDFYTPDCEGGVVWDDPDLAIDWPAAAERITLSDKDLSLPRLADLATPFVDDGRPMLGPGSGDLICA